jgi:hypothetical protein
MDILTQLLKQPDDIVISVLKFFSHNDLKLLCSHLQNFCHGSKPKMKMWTKLIQTKFPGLQQYMTANDDPYDFYITLFTINHDRLKYRDASDSLEDFVMRNKGYQSASAKIIHEPNDQYDFESRYDEVYGSDIGLKPGDLYNIDAHWYYVKPDDKLKRINMSTLPASAFKFILPASAFKFIEKHGFKYYPSGFNVIVPQYIEVLDVSVQPKTIPMNKNVKLKNKETRVVFWLFR